VITLYPKAVWRPLLDHSYPGTLAQRNLIVLHITDGPTAAGAISWFQQSKHPDRLSAHFVIDRDGTIYQLLPLEDTGFHASQVNSRSVGIEHAAIAGTLLATEEQYQASAELVAWLCALAKIPRDRAHVQTHHEASPADHHDLCCTGALDPDRVVREAVALGLPPSP
jgi:N-acetyl-anhydromuramyl-L-alanine amidase AmpD